jgi:hypothetical protein
MQLARITPKQLTLSVLWTIWRIIMTETATPVVKKEAKKYIEHPITLYPEFSGDRTQSDKRFGSHKFVLSLPIPTTNDEAQEFYGKTLKDLIIMGTIQNMYGESTFKTMCGDLTGDDLVLHVQEEVGEFDTDEGVKSARAYFEGLAKREPKVRSAKAKKDPYAVIAAQTGLSVEDIKAMIAARTGK